MINREMVDEAKARMRNIVLDYAVDVLIGDDIYTNCRNPEFFIDEHGYQWIKFCPNNGPRARQEHMRRTENIIVIKRESTNA